MTDANTPAGQISKLEIMRRSAELDYGDNKPVDVVETIAERILEATTAEAVFSAARTELESSDSLLNVPLLLLKVTRNRSSYEEGLPFYTVVYSIDTDRIEHVFSIGGTTAQSMLYRWDQMDAYPLVAVLVEKPSQSTPGNVARFFRPPTSAESKLFNV